MKTINYAILLILLCAACSSAESKKVPDLTEATSLGDTDVLYVVQGGASKKITGANLLATRALDSAAVHKTGNETIAGQKTFSSYLYASGGIDATGTNYFNNGGLLSVGHIHFQSNNYEACDTNTKGRVRYNSGSAGVADTAKICMKNSADVYGWHSIDTTTIDTSTYLPYSGASSDVNLGTHNLTTTDSLLAKRVVLNNASQGTVYLNDFDISVGMAYMPSGGGGFTVHGTTANVTTSGSVTASEFTGATALTLSTSTPPTCGSGYKGQVRYTAGSAGVADTAKICMKNAADAYAWHSIDSLNPGASVNLGANSLTAGPISGTTVSGSVSVTSGAISATSYVQISSTTPPTCTVSQQGQFRYTAGGTSVKDNVQVCAKDASDNYAWRTIY